MPDDPQHRLAAGARALLAGTLAPFVSLAAVVLAFTGAWTRGALVIDGPGVALYVRLALDHLIADGRVPYWMPEVWAGTPAWAIAPSFQVLSMVPLAAVIGSGPAAKVAILSLQVAGAWGAYVLAHSLWRHRPAAFVAGVVYGLSPIVVALAGLLGSESSLGPIAATPWLVWSFRKGIRGEGTRYLVGAGLLSAFAVLQQAEYAYGLALLATCLLIVEIGRVRTGLAGTSAGRARAGLAETSVGRLLARTALVGAVGLGAIAYWLLPFLALQDYFILSPPELVNSEFATGIIDTVGRELGVFLRRSAGLEGVTSASQPNLINQALYLGYVPLAVTIATAALIARRDDDRTLSAVLLASVVAVWMSTGPVSIAGGGPAERGQVLALAATGLVAGLVVGGFVRRVGLRRWTAPVLVAAAALLFVAPYLKPFVLLREAVPLLNTIRFPRFYVVAVLGLSLGTAWPVAHLGRWLPAGRARLAPVAAGALALVLAGAMVIDAWPYRSFYRLQAPADRDAYREASAAIADRPRGSRVLPGTLDPQTVSSLLKTGTDLTMGWPHPLASKQVWRLTVEASLAPADYGDSAYGLSATEFISKERFTNAGGTDEKVSSVELERNPRNLPIVRAYDRALVVADRSITPELAVSLAHRNIGVVEGGAGVSQTLGATALPTTIPVRACNPVSTGDMPAAVAGEVGLACAMRAWLPPALVRSDLFGGTNIPGARFTALADGMNGVGAWLFDPSGQAELVLRELDTDGRALGPEVARVTSPGVDEYGMNSFPFPPVPESAGKQYAFEIECPGCFAELAPQMAASQDGSRRGNLLSGGRLDPGYLASFAPSYERLPRDPPSSTTLEWKRPAPGRWQVDSSGPRPSLVVIAEANFPGWKARVDGRPVEVLEADGAFIGIPVPAGTHQIVVDYHRPPAADVGRLITGATLLAIVIGGLRSRRRRIRRSSAPPTPAPGALSSPADP